MAQLMQGALITSLKQKTGYGFPLITAVEGLLSGVRPTPSPGPGPVVTPPGGSSGSGSGPGELTAVGTESTTAGPSPLTVDFVATVSGGSSPYTYLWEFGDGASADTSSASHRYSSTGTYTPTLTVTDSSGNSTGAITLPVITVTQPVQVTLSIKVVQGTAGVAGSTVTVNGTQIGTTDSNGYISYKNASSGSTYTITAVKLQPYSQTTYNIYRGTVKYTASTSSAQNVIVPIYYVGKT